MLYLASDASVLKQSTFGAVGRGRKNILTRFRKCLDVVTCKMKNSTCLAMFLTALFCLTCNDRIIRSVLANWSVEAADTRGVDPYGTGGTRPPIVWTVGGHYHECPPQYF